MAEFLPLCDVLFNVISLAGYFCDVVFDVVMGYALLERGYKRTFAAAMTIIVTSLVISQVLSLRWYLHMWYHSNESRKGRPPWLPVMLHCLQLGVLWRYAKLFVPVDLRHVKHQVRDLCMLRLVHAFCEAAPMLLLQLHVYLSIPEEELDLPAEPTRDEPAANKAFEELNVISASLSMFSVCWALASFSKNVRLQNVHRLVLTWLGVIFQFLWRLGTISARITALTLYALVYEYWVFLVIGLHWLSMYLWLISPKNVFHGERISRPRKAYLSALIAYVYVFAYINLQELNHRQKMVTFYCVMVVENCVLVSAWWWGSPRPSLSPLATTAGGVLAGLAAMCLYYRYFHVRRLGYLLGENQQGTNSTNASTHSKNGKQSVQADNAAIPGVFNCRFTNPVGAVGRKKKKPTSFVPPPPAPATAFWRRPLPTTHNHHGGSSENEGSSVGSRVNIQQKLQEKKQKQLAELRVIEEEIKQGKLASTTPVAPEEIYTSLQRQPIPRSKTHGDPPTWPADISHPYQNYPLTHNCNVYPTYTEIKSPYAIPDYPNKDEELKLRNMYLERTYYETPIAVTDKINYIDDTQNTQNQNYEAERQNQFEENTNLTNFNDNKQTFQTKEYNVQSTYDFSENRFQYPLLGSSKSRLEQVKKMQRCRTPEILLSPQYLEGLRQQTCCHWGTPIPCTTRKKEDREGVSSGGDSVGEDVPRGPSDIDSQISLPRSYTLPREFRYWKRRTRLRLTHAPSNNSSDGDVDSGDNDSDRRSNCSGSSQNHGHVYNDPYMYNAQRPDLLSRTQDGEDRRSHEGHTAAQDRSRRHANRKHIKPETKL